MKKVLALQRVETGVTILPGSKFSGQRCVKDEKVILARVETLALTLSFPFYYPVEKISATDIILTGIFSHEVDSKRMQYLYLLLKTPHWMVMTMKICLDWPRLALNLSSSCPRRPSAAIPGVCHSARRRNYYFYFIFLLSSIVFGGATSLGQSKEYGGRVG